MHACMLEISTGLFNGSMHPQLICNNLQSALLFHTHMASSVLFHLLFSQLLLLLLLPLPSFSLETNSSRIPALIVFGDSTVDAGNNNGVDTTLKSNFPPYGRDFAGGRATGRFCNGRLATDFISEALGLPPTVPAYLDASYGIEHFAKGVCFASAGTGLDNATSNVLNVIPLWREVEYFKEYKSKLVDYVGIEKAEHIVGEAVYIVSIGTNDFLENYYLYVTGRFRQFRVEEFTDFLVGQAAGFLAKIYQVGARKVSFTGLGPIGCLPLERATNLVNGGRCIEEYNKVARDFNAKMQAMFLRLCASLPGFKVRYSPVYDALLHIVQNPSSYGFENSEQGCCATGMYEMGYLCGQWNPLTCPDANKYVFWDAFHPTEKANSLMAQQALRTSLAEFL